MKKRFLSLIFATILVCQLVIPVTAQEKNSYQRGKEVLLASGWSLSDIEYFLLPEDVENFASCLPAISSSKKYYRATSDGFSEVSETECFAAVQLYQTSLQNGNISLLSWGDNTVTNDGYLEYDLSVFPLEDGENYLLQLNFDWLTSPPHRRRDVIGLGHGTTVDQVGNSSGVTTRYYATLIEFDGSSTTTSTHMEIPTAHIGAGGSAFSFDLYDDTYSEMYSLTATEHRGFIQYIVTPNNSNATSSFAKGEYLHQSVNVSISPSISYPWGGSISVTPSSKYDALLPNPYCSFSL